MESLREDVQRAIAAAEGAAEGGFAARAAAIEHLEIHAIERLQPLVGGASFPADLQALWARAKALRRQLGKANVRVLRELRRQVRSGRSTPQELQRMLASLAGPLGASDGYDTLDLLVGGLIRAGPLGAERVVREPEMVFYQPTPARAILALVERAGLGPEDLLYDLGSGLGHVVILVALLSGARARGIELEPAYIEYARRCARRLNAQGVEFIQADAREAPLADGTVYFLYTPFRGALLQDVLGRLEAEARQRPIRVCTYGPCTFEVAAAPWLKPSDASAKSEHEVAVFQSM